MLMYASLMLIASSLRICSHMTDLVHDLMQLDNTYSKHPNMKRKICIGCC